MHSPAIRRAIISVSDKTGLTEFAIRLAARGVEICSTGGTRRHLMEAGIPSQDVAEYTGFPEMMDGRLKTLHPKIFGGILSRRDRDDDMAATAQHGIRPFELVVVNLYPFEKTIAQVGTTNEDAVEQIDIGGPSLVRAAAKNHAFVTIATAPQQYGEILEELESHGATSLQLRRKLMAEAFAHTASYDALIAAYFGRQWLNEPLPELLSIPLRREYKLRYGENPHQLGGLYRVVGEDGANMITARQCNGKELSYNNLLDLDSALAIVRSFDQPAAVVIKHNNPCGAATAKQLVEAARAGMEGDPQSAFGSVLGFNRTVDHDTAEYLCSPGLFVEAIVAPDFSPAALEILTTRPKWKANVRLMAAGDMSGSVNSREFRRVDGGFLVQDADIQDDPEAEWKVVSNREPTVSQWADLRFGWRLVRFVKSNAIVVCCNGALLGAGAGQMSRVDSVEIAIRKAGDRIRGAVLASDAFFPFPDSIEQAAAAGIAAVIQPGGSKNDDQVIDACNRHGLSMILTGRRHFKH